MQLLLPLRQHSPADPFRMLWPTRGLTIKICAWCGKDLELRFTPDMYEIGRISHGMCPQCREEMETL